MPDDTDNAWAFGRHDSVRRLDAHHAELIQLVAAAQRSVDRGRLEAAAVDVQVAGMYAWLNHTGLFASPALEAVLLEIGHRLTPGTANRSRERRSPPVQVLHVATQVYGVGGHTRMLARWISEGGRTHHRVCLTRQGANPIPEFLLSELDERSDLWCLDAKRGGLVTRAAALRAAARDADIVLLHTHPYDVVPVIAFASGSDMPPVVYVNHADHVFWLGVTVANVLLNLRESGRALAIDRRGVDSTRTTVMARPLGRIERELGRSEAKKQLGLDPDCVLIATAAAATKYEPVSRPSFLDLIVPVLARHQQAVLLAAGPEPAGQWATADELTAGRVRALGLLPNAAALQQAADIYIDSFPFASLTSLIEAGSYGTPVITYRGHPEECAVLGADTRGLDEYMLSPSTPAALRSDLDHLIEDASARNALGARTKQAIRETHTGEGWRSAVADLYEFALEVQGEPSIGPVVRGTGMLDSLVDLVQERTGFSDGLRGATYRNLGLLPAGTRIATWTRSAVRGAPPSIGLLFPEWLHYRLARWARSRRKHWHPQGGGSS